MHLGLCFTDLSHVINTHTHTHTHTHTEEYTWMSHKQTSNTWFQIYSSKQIQVFMGIYGHESRMFIRSDFPTHPPHIPFLLTTCQPLPCPVKVQVFPHYSKSSHTTASAALTEHRRGKGRADAVLKAWHVMEERQTSPGMFNSQILPVQTTQTWRS